MSHFICYKPATGEIVMGGFADPAAGSAPYDLMPVWGVDPSIGSDTHYFNIATDSIAPKLVMTPTATPLTVAANGTAIVTVASLPTVCKVAVTGPQAGQGDITDGQLQLSFDTPGVYTLRFTAMHFMPYEVIVHAT